MKNPKPEIVLATQDAILPPSLARWTASVLSRVAQQMRERFETRVAHLGLRNKHYGVLIVLQDGPLTQTEISRSVAVDRTSMVGLIDELDRLGLVERARHPQDRRAHAVTLTEQGREALRLTTAAVDATEAECFAALSPGEQKQLRALLLKLL